MKSATRVLAVFCLAVLTASAFAQAPVAAPSCDPADPTCDMNIAQVLAFYRKSVNTEVATDVVQTNRATTAPPTSAANIHNSYEDFLNQLSFAINKVDQTSNAQALVIRYNPVREGSNLFGATLTVAQPELSDTVANAIPADTRDATVALLEKNLGNANDLTWAAEWSPSTADCPPDRSPKERCWGRTPSTYSDIISAALLKVIPSSPMALGNAVANLIALFPNAPNLNNAMLSQATDRAAALKLIQEQVGIEQGTDASTKSLYEDNHLDLLATLIDNQPQAALTVSYHMPGDLGGPKTTAAAFELHWGASNMNALRAKCPRLTGDPLGTCVLQQLASLAANGLSPDSFTLTASYNRDQSYRVDSLGLTPPVTGFTPIDLEQADSVNFKAQGGRLMQTQISEKPIRVDLSAEGQWAKKGSVRTANRWVATLTFAIPLGGDLTIPVSVNYANKPEFLDAAQDHIGAHIGLSYRIPNVLGGAQ
jgi:hypothetical protein